MDEKERDESINERIGRILAGDLVLYRRSKPDFVQRSIRKVTGSVVEHVEVVGERDAGLVLGNSHFPQYSLDDFRDRIDEYKAGGVSFVVIRMTDFELPRNEVKHKIFRRDVTMALDLFAKVPPKYDTYSIAVIMGNITKTWIRDHTRWLFRGKEFLSTRNKEHKVYCSELAEIIYAVCGHLDILRGLGPQTHSAPVHLERQVRSGVFTVVADFGDLSRLIFAKK